MQPILLFAVSYVELLGSMEGCCRAQIVFTTYGATTGALSEHHALVLNKTGWADNCVS